jgi:anti-anti-sigma factor
MESTPPAGRQPVTGGSFFFLCGWSDTTMAQATIVGGGWDFEVHRGPDWLFVRPRRISETLGGDEDFAEQVWGLLEQQFTHRLVLEMEDVSYISSLLVGQLVWLYKRIHSHDGLMRICGLSDFGAEVLHTCRLSGHFPRYRTREDAVMGAVQVKPR